MLGAAWAVAVCEPSAPDFFRFGIIAVQQWAVVVREVRHILREEHRGFQLQRVALLCVVCDDSIAHIACGMDD